MESRIIPIPATFKSTEEFKHLCETDPTIPALYYEFTEVELTPLAKLFADSSDLEDWLWLARYNAAFMSSTSASALLPLSPLAESVLNEMVDQIKNGKMSDVMRIKTVFSSAQPFISLAAICPTFTDAILTEFRGSPFNYSQQLFSFFADPAIFFEFLQASLQRRDIDRGLLNTVCVTIMIHHRHYPYVYEHSNYFAALDKKFVEIFLRELRRDLSLFSMLKTGDNTYVLENFSHVFQMPDQLDLYHRSPKSLIDLAKTAHGLAIIVTLPQFQLSNPEFEKYIQSPDCDILDKLRSFPAPGTALVQLAQANPALMNLLIQHHAKKILDIVTYTSAEERACLASYYPDFIAPAAPLPSVAYHPSALLTPPSAPITEKPEPVAAPSTGL